MFFQGQVLKYGYSLDTYTPAYGFAMGETFYRIFDSVGLVFQTTLPGLLAPFFEPDPLPF